MCSHGNPRSRVPQKSECPKYSSVHRHPPHKSMMWYFLENLEVVKDEHRKSELDQMLPKRACPKFDVDCVRQADIRDLRLVPSEISRIFFRPLPACASLGSAKLQQSHREEDECFTTKSL